MFTVAQATLVKYGVIGLILLCLFGWVGFHYHNKAVQQCTMEKQVEVSKAKDLLIKAIEENDELKANNLKLTQGIQSDYKEHELEIAGLHSTISKLGKLRDPYAKRPNCPAMSTNDPKAGIPPETTTVPGELSDEATAFLRDFAYQCDTVATYAKGCYEFSTKVAK